MVILYMEINITLVFIPNYPKLNFNNFNKIYKILIQFKINKTNNSQNNNNNNKIYLIKP